MATRKTFDQKQDEAFAYAKKNPTTDHELLELFDKGEFLYEPYVRVKTREEYERERWDQEKEITK